MLMRHIPLIVFTFLLCIAAPIAAQDAAPDTGWPIEQRCIGDPTPPPADWTYDGTIFVQGMEGIRALNPNFRTPYFTLFYGDFYFAAELSPDGRWYAVPSGHTEPGSLLGTYYVIETLDVFSTGIERTRFRVPWETSVMSSSNYYLPKVLWVDNEHIAFETGYMNDSDETMRIVNPFTGELVAWEYPPASIQVITPSLYWHFSPDRSRVIFENQSDRPEWGVYDWQSETIITSIPPVDESYVLPSVIWRPDSRSFVAVIVDESNNRLKTLRIFDNDGKPADMIMGNDERFSFANLDFSSDGQYLAANLYVVDFEQKKVFDICAEADKLGYINHAVWSPTNSQMAFTSNGDVVILDTETWQLYTIASNIADVIDWGAAD
jgi:hypothetical protein